MAATNVALAAVSPSRTAYVVQSGEGAAGWV